MMAGFTLKSRSLVRKHPNPRRVIEFYGGEAIGLTPHLSYSALLEYLYEQGHTVIAMPVPIGPNHEEIARFLIEERRAILCSLGYNPDTQPSCMIGHSIGGQMIALLAKYTDVDTNAFVIRGQKVGTGLMGTPILFMAPFIGDFDNAGWASKLLNAIGLGFQPTMAEIIAMFEEEKAQLFARASLLAFDKDQDAGTLDDCRKPIPSNCTKSVPWFRHYMQPMGRPCQQIAGGHLTPMGALIGGRVYQLSLDHFSAKFPRQVETTVLDMLEQLDQGGAKLATAINMAAALKADALKASVALV